MAACGKSEDELKSSRVLSMSDKNIQRRKQYKNRDERSRLREAVRLKRQHTIQHGKKLMRLTAWSLLNYEKQQLLLFKIEGQTRDWFSNIFLTKEDYDALDELAGPKIIAEEALKKVLNDNSRLFSFGEDDPLPSELIHWMPAGKVKGSKG